MYHIEHSEELYHYVMDNIQYGKPIGFDGEKVTIADPHHALIHDSKHNRETYPFLIDNPMNVYYLTRRLHNAYPNWGLIENLELIEMLDVQLCLFSDELDKGIELLETTIKKFSEDTVGCIETIAPELLTNELFIERIPHGFNYITYLRR